MRRIVCFPGCAARQPSPGSDISADSIGCSALSEVTSTLANRSRSNQASSKRETDSEPELIVCLRIGHPLQYRQRQNITQYRCARNVGMRKKISIQKSLSRVF